MTTYQIQAVRSGNVKVENNVKAEKQEMQLHTLVELQAGMGPNNVLVLANWG